MNRPHLQKLAEERLLDAQALLAAERWSAAYYLAGYTVECGLKSCVLRHLDATGAIFTDAEYLKSLAGCWTHDIEKLIKLAGLIIEFGKARQADPALDRFWAITKNWSETSRYKEAAENDARELVEAITHEPNGVLRWIRTHW
ncbi:hypothetical protein R5W23_002832 [Gemmata sp. JC673]|uniref:HEPN domain-containing protein n=1 Tax=Gemmata algarum TaxID=2975278 RepID=A0ABU5F6P9_9BACT|nr:hypothetical protein [Gemmata algarum]MDY3561554.1 hypothetical protein [Gemmata algarum]